MRTNNNGISKIRSAENYLKRLACITLGNEKKYKSIKHKDKKDFLFKVLENENIVNNEEITRVATIHLLNELGVSEEEYLDKITIKNRIKENEVYIELTD